MPVTFNVRHVEDQDLRIKGEISAEELDIHALDELIHVRQPLHYDLHAEKMERSILVQGRLDLQLNCECARCLKPFEHRLLLPDWACHLALEGEEKVVISNDVVDLTPYIREDIVLSFPQHPLCRPDCKGLEKAPQREPELTSTAWSELNKLKL
jgi:uncharacterized metal-binding protein YceD (DUF177 family)